MASEDIGSLFNTKMPGYDDPADIQDALKLYHYGSTTYDENNTDPNNLLNPSLAYHLQQLKNRAQALEDLGAGSDYLTETQVEAIADPQDGFIWLDVNSSGNGAPTYAAAVYSNEAPTTGLVDGIIWVDKDSSPRRAYIYNAGTSTWDIIDDIQSIINASGDLIYGTANDTVNRLGIGSNGQVLTVSSGLPSWQTPATPETGSETLLGTYSLTGPTVTVSGIAQTYKHIRLEIINAYVSAGGYQLGIYFNNDTSNIYSRAGFRLQPGGGGSFVGSGNENFPRIPIGFTNMPTVSDYSIDEVLITNYTSTDHYKMVKNWGHVETNNVYSQVANYRSASAITSITLYAGGTNFSGGSVRVYGVK